MNKHTSNVMRFNITLPADVGTKLAPSKNRSAVIAEALRQKFASDEKERLDAILARAYADAAEEDRQIAKDWDTTIGDGL